MNCETAAISPSVARLKLVGELVAELNSIKPLVVLKDLTVAPLLSVSVLGVPDVIQPVVDFAAVIFVFVGKVPALVPDLNTDINSPLPSEEPAVKSLITYKIGRAHV